MPYTPQAHQEAERIQFAVDEAMRFIGNANRRLAEHQAAQRSNDYVPSPSQARAAMRRASLDLSTALADLRRREV